MSAVRARNASQLDKAIDLFEALLSQDPRLAEVHIELAHIGLDTSRLEDAEGHAKQAIDLLESNGIWLETFELDTVKSVAYALLAEALRRRADEDDVIFGDPEVFRSLVAESKKNFEIAAGLDPNDAASSYYAFFLGSETEES